MKRLLMLVISAAVLVAASASGAFAGEVKGPPGTPCGGPNQPACAPNGNDNRTAAPEHSNSACSFSGLNDMNPNNGPTDSITQTPKGSRGAPGHGTGPGTDFPIGCRGGSNPENPPGS
jgi:hypothetical protein